jgi:hypothetical protein
MKTLIRLKEKRNMLLLCSVFCAGIISAQQVYDDFEGNTSVNYDTKSGGHVKLTKNPAPNEINSSGNCAVYTRSNREYDNIKMDFKGRLENVDKYASYEPQPPRFKMKLYTKAPVGSVVELQLIRRGSSNPYPENIYGQFIARTQKSGEWEELEFRFLEKPQGCKITANDVDEIVLLFTPNSIGRDKFYFDDVTGPSITSKSDVTSKAGTK